MPTSRKVLVNNSSAKKSARTPQKAATKGVELRGSRVTGNVAGRDVHIHSVPFATSPPPLDISAYLRLILHDVEHIEINGIASRVGRSREALICKIEELYTPLASRHPGEMSSGASSSPRASEHVLLPALLPKHERLLLIGQAGSGKSTFLRLVACMLARDLLGPRRKPSWRLQYLGLSEKKKPRIPCLLRMSTLASLFENHTTHGRLDTRAWILDLLSVQCCPKRSHITDALRDPGHEARCVQWDALLVGGKAVLLLDGLDEIADPVMRARVLRVFQDACATWSKSQIVVTSRPIELMHLRALRFYEATIEPFGPSEVARFVEQWSIALFNGYSARSEEHERTLRAAIRERPEIRRLATNPVMLTCLCVIHWNEGRMPEGRARVYRAISNWMLGARSDQRRRVGFTDAFAGNSFPALALAMTSHAEGKQATFDVGEAAVAIDDELRRHIRNFTSELQQRCVTDADRRRLGREWLLRECEWSHIVQEIAGNRLCFWHLTLQEFLTALALAWRDDSEELEGWWPIVRLHLDDAQWRETLELLPGCLYDEGGQRRVDCLIERVLKLATYGELESEARVIGIVGYLLRPLSIYEYSPRPQVAADYESMQKRVMPIFDIEGARIALATRIRAAEALGRSGDPRLSLGNFILLPGTRGALGRYPVTVAEFARFLDDDEGYMLTAVWDTAGWRWRSELGREGPWNWDEQKSFPNRPVTGVSWWEARAYCRWLGQRLVCEARLPLVSEWEKAATPQQGGFPWGTTEPNDSLANFRNAVGAPTPIGLYPAGAGPYGHLDLSGNVDEWCDDGPRAEPDVRWLKGSSWLDTNPVWLATSFRNRGVRGIENDDRYGFRVLVSVPHTEQEER